MAEPTEIGEVERKLDAMLEFLETLPDIQAAAVVRRDGLMIASSLPKEIDARTVAAITAAIVGTAETSAAELQLGRFLQVIVEAEKGRLIATGAGSTAILICLASERANLGLVLLEMGRVAHQVEESLEAP
jgi:predicted regulator of Ras-like GTPase activity (Roadblock/LC7/MglB family)